MALKAPVPKQFDDAKLATMIEPFTVRVDKIRAGNQRSNIPLPETEGAPGQSGVGWDRGDVRQLEQFLVNEWSGGGTYSIKITDSNNQALEWVATYDPQLYPEKIPPTLQTGADPRAVMSHPAPNKGRVAPMTAFPNGLPSFGQAANPYAQPGYPQYAANPYYPPMPPPPPYHSPAYPMYREEARERAESAELRALREQTARQERATLEAQHKAELERDRQATQAQITAQAAQMTELRNMIANLATAISSNANAQAQKPNGELEALRLQLQAAENKAEQDRRERESERRDQATRDLIKAAQDASEKQINAMMRQLEAFQASLAAVNANRQDPMIEMLREQSRQSAEAIKAIATSHATTIDKMQTNSMHPRDILSIVRESSQQADAVTDKLTTSFGRVIDLQAKVTENAIQLQPQGSPVVDMIRDGAGHVREMAERYLGRAELQAQLQAAQQQKLLEAQRDVQIATIQAQTGLGGVQPQQPQLVDGGGMNFGSGMNGQAPAPTPRKKKAKADAAAPQGSTKKRLGKTDQEWFGPVTNNILQLREGVAQFMESLKNNNVGKDGMPIGASPEQAAMAITEGVSQVAQHNLLDQVPAIPLLLGEFRYADFLEVVLPDASENYRADVVQALVPMLRGATGGGDGMTGEPTEPTPENEEDEGDEDEGDDQGADEDTDAQPDDGDDSANDGVETTDRKPQLAVVPTVAKSAPNGRPANPPRRT